MAAVAPELAGTGSSRTETLIQRVAGLILGGEAPDRPLCITFTAKAARKMLGQLLPLLELEQGPRWVGIFHAVMAWPLIWDGDSALGLLRWLRHCRLERRPGAVDAGQRPSQGEEEADLLQVAISLLRNVLAAP